MANTIEVLKRVEQEVVEEAKFLGPHIFTRRAALTYSGFVLAATCSYHAAKLLGESLSYKSEPPATARPTPTIQSLIKPVNP